MKIEPQYLKDLLIAFENTDGPDTLLHELEEQGFSRNASEFIFHMRLLDDNGLITRIDGQSGFGHDIQLYIGGHDYHWFEVPLRLTARGHDFIADLRQQEVWQAVKTNFKDEGLSSLMTITKSLAEAFAKKKIKDLTGIEL